MGSHIYWPIRMGPIKTTIEISDSLPREVRKLAAREGVTLRALAERGLHRVVAESTQGTPFRLRRASFKGQGRQPDFADASWEKVRDAIYKDRGA